MRTRYYLTVVAVVVCLFTGSCATYRYSTSVADSTDCLKAHESVIRADAVATGYEMAADRMIAFAERVFAGLSVTAADCTRNFNGVAFCAIHTPPKRKTWDTHMHTLGVDFRVEYPADVFEARLLCRSRQDMTFQRHSYVIDGMQVVRIYTWYEIPDEYVAVVFEPAETE